MKKRSLAIVLTVVMALALAVPSFAAMPTATVSHEVLVDSTPNSVYDAATHQNLQNTQQQLIKVYHNGLYGYVNPQGQIAVQEKYTEIGNFSTEGLAWAKKNGVAVYVNTQGVEVISVGVATPHDFHNGMARITDAAGNTYFIDTTGKCIFNLGVEEAGEFDDTYGLTWVRSSLDGHLGIVNKVGQEVSHFQYTALSINSKNQLNFQNGLVRAETASGVCFVNSLGQIPITMRSGFTFVDDFCNGMCLVKDANNQVGYMDTTGYLAVYCQYEDGERFNSLGIARIKRNGLYGYINGINAYAVQPLYNYLSTDVAENSGLVLARRWVVSANAYKYGYVNVFTGAEQIGFRFDYARPFSEGLAWARVLGQHGYITGFINEAGNVVFDCSFYDDVGNFHSGLAWAAKNGKYGYINKTGVLAITARYDVDYRDGVAFGYNPDVPNYRASNHAPFDFQSDLALVRLADFSGASRYGIINTAGTVLYNPTFSDVLFFAPDLNDVVALFQNAGSDNTIVTLTR